MKELIIVEDKKENFEQYKENLQMRGVKLRHFDSKEKISELLKTNHTHRSYFVDINLGSAKRKEGIEIIKEIRRTEKESLVIVYTAHEDFKDECYSSGADMFFTKIGGEKTIDDFVIFKNIFQRFFNLLSIEHQKCVLDVWKGTSIIPAKVFDFNDEFVTLNCMINTDKQLIVEKKFPKSIIGDVSIGDSIMVTIKDRPKRICYLFERDSSDNVSKYFLDKELKSNDEIDDCLFV